MTEKTNQMLQDFAAEMKTLGMEHGRQCARAELQRDIADRLGRILTDVMYDDLRRPGAVLVAEQLQDLLTAN